MSCRQCIHWDCYDGDLSKNLGDCRKHPPRISETLLARYAMPASYRNGEPEEMENDLYAASAFPVTHATSTCGEEEGQMPC